MLRGGEEGEDSESVVRVCSGGLVLVEMCCMLDSSREFLDIRAVEDCDGRAWEDYALDMSEVSFSLTCLRS